MQRTELMGNAYLRCPPMDVSNVKQSASSYTLKLIIHRYHEFRSELQPLKSLPILPKRWDNIHASHRAAISCSDHKWETLPEQVTAELPVLTPVAPHRLPPSLWSSDFHCSDISIATYVWNEDKVVELVPIHGEVHSPTPPARSSARIVKAI